MRDNKLNNINNITKLNTQGDAGVINEVNRYFDSQLERKEFP